MTRYFYTDPLAAAWMQAEYGMRFLSSPDSHFDDVGMPTSLINVHTRGYIHPDCLHLLEPQVGDVLYSNIGGGVSVEEMLCEERATQTAPHIIQRGGRIIQRNSKPFHWPESEGA